MKAEKQVAMEVTWESLLDEELEPVSPDWHRDVLEDRQRRIDAREETFVEWSSAKEQLRSEFERGRQPA